MIPVDMPVMLLGYIIYIFSRFFSGFSSLA